MSSSILGYINKGDDVNSSPYEFTGKGIQRLVDSLSGAGGVIHLPAGEYKVAAPITIAKGNVTLKGEVNGATKLIFAFEGACLSVNAAAAVLADVKANLEISDLWIEGPATDTYVVANGIALNYMKDTLIQRCKFTGCNIAIYNNNAQRNVRVVDCTNESVGTLYTGSLLVSESTAGTLGAVNAQGCRSYAPVKAAYVIKHSAEGSTLKSCQVFSQSLGAGSPSAGFLLGSTTGSLKAVTLTDCDVLSSPNASEGIYFFPSAAQTLGAILISGCQIDGPAKGIRVNQSSLVGRLSITNCQIENTTGNSIDITGVGAAGPGLTLAQNQCAATCALGATFVTMQRSTITANHFNAAAGTGIVTPIPGTVDDCIFLGNHYKGVVTDSSTAPFFVFVTFNNTF